MTKDQVGSVAEEAAKLFAALTAPSDTSGSPETDSPQPGDISRECQWCPLCQLIRRLSPEVLGSVRALLDAAREAAVKSGTPAAHDSAGSDTKVDRIDVSEDPQRWD